MEDCNVRSAASILASVKEQEARFERLTRALEQERRHVALQLERAQQPGMSSGGMVGSGQDLPMAWQQLVLQEQSPGSQASLATMPEAPEVLEETVTVEEDPGTPTSHVSIVTSEDGTTRRTETKVTKTVKTVTTRTVRQVPLGPDGLPLLDGGPPLGSFADGPLDRHFLLRGGGPAATLSRAYLSSGGGFPDGPEPRDIPSYGSLSRGLGVRPPRTGLLGPGPGDGCFTLPGRREAFPMGSEPGPPSGRSLPEHFQAEPYGLEDDTRSLAADDEGGPDLEPDYGTAARRRHEYGRGLRTRAFEDTADDAGELIDERPSFPAATAPLAQPERGSLGSLDRVVRRSPSVDSARKEPRWRDPELPEVLAMLRHPVDPVKANAAAYLQHLCFENEGIKRRVRQLRGLPLLVALLDHPRAEVRRRACGALRNLSYGRDADNKAAIRDCGGVPALVRLLRAARDNEVRELVTGTLWNLSSYEPLKMVIIDHGLQTLTHEVIVPHSGWEREPNEDSKPRDAEWTTVFKNTSGCLRNVSSDGAEARRRLRECEGLVDALLHALQSAVGRKDTDNKSVENCVCIMRNLSYHVHKEVPGADRYQETEPGIQGSATASQRRRKDDVSCFGGKKAKEEWFHQGKKDGEMDRNYDTLDLPKRTEAAKGFELLYQPEVVRLYLSLLTESRNFNTLEAAAGALQNLSAGNWTWATCIRATVRKERGLPVLVELLQSETDKVVRAVAIALRNLSLDQRNKDLIGSYAMTELVRDVRSAQAPAHPGAHLEEDTVVAVLNTIHEIVSDSLDNARSLLQARGVPALVALVASSQSVREAKAASHVLQTVWSYKELRGALQKDGWTKARFQSASTAKGPKGTPSPGGFDDSTLPLVDKNLDGEKSATRDVIPMDTLGPDGYATVDRRERRTLGSDSTVETSEKELLKPDPGRKAPLPGPNRPSVRLVDAVGDAKPQPVDSWV
ncbi:armadillo repeat protein deleted in velo-cardio-facial syndrome isoform X1 [Onychomys torridus]|uniref:armadillo repeat protein deleted in velo-cardio-facial syndrome isoform X1 n=2 Tax=Onychomys torridus TaxID=38674 RepID=UPI00167FB82D|nr:armadillo repeat protein deleted in velo-cardio-facial syndrome isoform X1 [Onychomys torridus]XP_036052188.1 armadillo repeat protein deleted in velo-cardio-facial syndrome isoform X1 [Onychomys torridus]XP_036052189.1 armadillo repeat protein deleted in velo-cardio-facial syndrome isoform X1 [Onychomys torridus]